MDVAASVLEGCFYSLIPHACYMLAFNENIGDLKVKIPVRERAGSIASYAVDASVDDLSSGKR